MRGQDNGYKNTARSFMLYQKPVVSFMVNCGTLYQISLVKCTFFRCPANQETDTKHPNKFPVNTSITAE